MIATLKHFPGHGDTTSTRTSGLPIIKDPRSRSTGPISAVQGRHRRRRGAIMTAHIEMPALDAAPNTPTNV
jgi:beta-glucosidase-like glycosyl hydrolase